MNLSARTLVSTSFLALFLVAAPARAAMLQGATTHGRGDGSVGAYGSLFVAPTTGALAIGQVTYGFLDRLQGEARVGALAVGGTTDVFLGLYAKYHLLSTKVIQLGLWGGLTRLSVFAFDFALPISHAFSNTSLELYAAPYVSIPFTGGAGAGVAIIPGMNIGIARSLKLYAEAAIGLTAYPTSINAGVRYFF
jgi:hypothetical protein